MTGRGDILPDCDKKRGRGTDAKYDQRGSIDFGPVLLTKSGCFCRYKNLTVERKMRVFFF